MNNAKFITVKGEKDKRAPKFRKCFSIEKEVEKAVLKVTAYGVYDAKINGETVSWFMAPGWTQYEKQLQYQTYDVTKLIKEENEISVTVGDGWAMSRLAGWEANNILLWADKPAVIAALKIDFNDGTSETLVSDESWQFAYGPYTGTQIYDGESFDSTKEFKDYENVDVIDLPKDNLVEQYGEEVGEIQKFKPCELIITPKGERVIDFGQNMTGYISFNVCAPKGTKIYITCAEVLDRDGNFYNDNYRSARSAFDFIANGEKQTYKPTFNFYGFRYIRLDEFPESFELDDFSAYAVSSKMERTGFFECDNVLVNKLFSNIIWGQLSNYLDVPTDCPQRDERLGWTGDAQAFVKTGSYNFNVEKFFTKWLADVAFAQDENGVVPHIVPKIPTWSDCAAGWADVCTIAPWQIYLTYANTDILKRQFLSMKKWVDYVESLEINDEHLWQVGNHFGDWLALDAEEGAYVGATDIYYIASAFYANSVNLLIKAHDAIKKSDADFNFGEEFDIEKYRKLYIGIKNDFNKKYIENSIPKIKTQTALVLAIEFNLTDDCNKAAAELNKMIKENNTALTTGFLGTPYLLHVLSDYGYGETAYDLLLRKEFPSWLFGVKQGATTMWEHWDGRKADGSFWSEDMNSFNHYAYGAVGDWIYECCLGINTDENEPGFKHIIFKPVFTNKLSYVKGSLKTKYGVIKSGWKCENDVYTFNITVPNECSATVILGDNTYEVGSGMHTYNVGRTDIK